VLKREVMTVLKREVMTVLKREVTTVLKREVTTALKREVMTALKRAGSYLIAMSIIAKFNVLVTSILAFALVFSLCHLAHSCFSYTSSYFSALALAFRGSLNLF